MMSHRKLVRAAAACAAVAGRKTESEREGSHRSSRQSCGEWQLNEESLFVLIQNHPLALHDYFPVMHYFAGSGPEYNTYYYYYYRPSN